MECGRHMADRLAELPDHFQDSLVNLAGTFVVLLALVLSGCSFFESPDGSSAESPVRNRSTPANRVEPSGTFPPNRTDTLTEASTSVTTTTATASPSPTAADSPELTATATPTSNNGNRRVEGESCLRNSCPGMPHLSRPTDRRLNTPPNQRQYLRRNSGPPALTHRNLWPISTCRRSFCGSRIPRPMFINELQIKSLKSGCWTHILPVK